MQFAEFHNALRIMHSIDLHEIHDAGIEMNAADWSAFQVSPARWLIRASDNDAEKLWTIIERRQPRRSPCPA